MELLLVVLGVVLGLLLYYTWSLRNALALKETESAQLRGKLTQIAEETARSEKSCDQAMTLAHSSYDALLVLDDSYTILAINSTAEAVFKVRGVLGKNLVEATNIPELELIVSGALASDEDGDASFEEQLTIREHSYRARAQVFRKPGQNRVLIGLALQDVSQLVRLNRARRDMVANISHELRTPIANIRLIIDGLFHEQDKPKRKESISSLKAIARETDSLLWLVQEMADLSMIESGQAIVRMYEVPLSELVQEAVERVQDQSETKDLKIVQHVPEKIKVLCDRDLAKRVIVNLVHNAIKWSPHGEAITINASNGADEVTINVIDNGPGVPDSQTERIFERFYQVDASRSGHEGTGLGLAICKHIVEAHGGRIWAHGNGDGGGGRFAFTLLNAGDHDLITETPEILKNSS